MDTKELRLGNLLFDDIDDSIMIVSMIELKEYTEWNSGNDYSLVCKKQGTSEYYEGDTFRHIPLTEEWLLKFGFEKFIYEPIKGEEEKCEEYCKGKLSIVDWGRGFIMSNSFNFTLRIELKYVHQLQNLYFALTGEELKIQQDA